MSRSAVMLGPPPGGEPNDHGVMRLGSTSEETAALQTTLAVLCVLLGGVMVLIPVAFLVSLSVMSGAALDRHPRAVIVLILLMAVLAALRFRYSPPVLFTVGSLLLAYGVAELAHASRAATLSALGIALLCSILLWGGLYLVGMLQRRRRGRSPTETVS